MAFSFTVASKHGTRRLDDGETVVLKVSGFATGRTVAVQAQHESGTPSKTVPLGDQGGGTYQAEYVLSESGIWFFTAGALGDPVLDTAIHNVHPVRAPAPTFDPGLSLYVEEGYVADDYVTA